MQITLSGNTIAVYSQWKRQTLMKQVYHVIVTKPVTTAHQKQTVDFSFIFLY